jgi:hypothetical protein
MSSAALAIQSLQSNIEGLELPEGGRPTAHIGPCRSQICLFALTLPHRVQTVRAASEIVLEYAAEDSSITIPSQA